MANTEYLDDQDAEEPDDFIISLTSQVCLSIIVCCFYPVKILRWILGVTWKWTAGHSKNKVMVQDNMVSLISQFLQTGDDLWLSYFMLNELVKLIKVKDNYNWWN